MMLQEPLLKNMQLYPILVSSLCDIQFVISDQLFLDILIMKVRLQSISYATMKKCVDQKRKGICKTVFRACYYD